MLEKYRQTDFPEMYIDMQPVVERMQPEESRVDFVGDVGVSQWCGIRMHCRWEIVENRVYQFIH